ncbi:MAG: PDZ domain-containing protein [Ardenticatenia bacterium]|nr:PDZ domain-containing protein [Ardenticatenia bacterium]
MAGPLLTTGYGDLEGRLRRALAHLIVEQRDANGRTVVTSSPGLIWDLLGHVVVPAQVVGRVSEVEAILPDGTTITGTVVGADAATNVAVVRLATPPDQMIPLMPARSGGSREAQAVSVVWNLPDGRLVIHKGRVVDTGRLLPVGAQQTDFGVSYVALPDVLKVELTEPVARGLRGAVVVDALGRFEGLVLPLSDHPTVVYAVPGRLMSRVVDGLVRQGTYRHPWLGISGQTITPALAQALNVPVTSGVLVLSVFPGSPADVAGLRDSSALVRVDDRLFYTGGDLITHVDEQRIRSVGDLIKYLVYHTEVGQQVTLTVVRDGRPVAVELTVGARPEVPIFD